MNTDDQHVAQIFDELEERDPNAARALATPPFPCVIKAAFAAAQAFAIALAQCLAENTAPDGYNPKPDSRCTDPNK